MAWKPAGVVVRGGRRGEGDGAAAAVMPGVECNEGALVSLYLRQRMLANMQFRQRRQWAGRGG
jgi:hypothetical protein